MKMKISLISLLALSLIANGYLYWRNTQQRFLVELVSQKDAINSQSVNEMTMMTLHKLREDNIELGRNQGRIEGMLAVISGHKPDQDEYSKIFHEGYYRGLDQKTEEFAQKASQKVDNGKTDKPTAAK